MGGHASKHTEELGASIETVVGSAQLAGEGVPHSQYDAVSFFEFGAEAGDPQAMCSLADCLMNGWGIEVDPWQAYDLYRRAAEEPHFWPPAMHCVGMCLRHGVGLEDNRNVSEEQAFQWFRKAATRDKDTAPILSLHEVGMCYLFGVGCSKFPRRGVSWLNNSAVLGHEPSQIALRNYYNSIDLDINAVDILSFAAEKNEQWALNNLGVIATRSATQTKEHDKKTGSQVANVADDKASLFFLPKEALGVAVGVSKEQQDARNAARTKFLAAIGTTTSTSFHDATEVADATDATDGTDISGVAEAFHNLGIMYIRGWCPPHDAYEGMSLIHRAATLGLSDAVCGLATCYLEGHGLRPSLRIATRLFREAAKLGSTEAQSQIAKSFLMGTGGVLESPSEAAVWYEMAAARGRPEAQARLGMLLLHGLPDEKPPLRRDPVRGVHLLRQAADAGDPDACRCLSECYEMGVARVSEEEERNLERRKRRGRTLNIQTLRQLKRTNVKTGEDEVVLLAAKKGMVAQAATLAGWKEADDADRQNEANARANERRRIAVAAGWQQEAEIKQAEDETLHLSNIWTPENKDPASMVIKVNLEKAQFWRERGGKIGDAIKNGDILKINDGFSFSIAAPMPNEETIKRKSKGERRKRKKTSKYVARVSRSSSRRRTKDKLDNSTAIVTPRVSNANNELDSNSDEEDNSSAAQKERNQKRSRHLPIPPLPMPVSLSQTTRWSEDHEVWQGPLGPGIPGFGMAVHHASVSVSQGSFVPAAKSSVFPWGGQTVST